MILKEEVARRAGFASTAYSPRSSITSTSIGTAKSVLVGRCGTGVRGSPPSLVSTTLVHCNLWVLMAGPFLTVMNGTSRFLEVR